MHRIIVRPRALDSLKGAPKPDRDRIRRQIDSLASEPRPSQARQLTGMRDVWKLPVGHYRICYSIKDDTLVVEVILAMHRRDVYRVLTRLVDPRS